MIDYNRDVVSFDLIKVVFVIRWPVGGIRTYLKYLVLSLPKDSYEIHVVGVCNDGMKALHNDIGSRVKSWVYVPESKNAEIHIFFSTLKFLMKNNVDILHAHGFTSLVCSVIPSLLTGVPAILTSHDVINDRQFKGVKGFLKNKLLNISLKACSKVTSVSYDAENNLLGYFPEVKENSLCIKNGIDSRYFYESPKVDIKDKVGLSNDVCLIGFFGRFMNQKGFYYLVKAVEILVSSDDEKKYHVVCFGSGAFIREEKLEIARRGLTEYFTFYPFEPDISGVMKGCDIIVMPSLWEACPLQPMEALCAGVPFVGTSCLGLREVLSGTPAVVVEPGNAVELARGIIACLQKGRKPFIDYASVAVDRFSVSNTADQIHDMYVKVLE